MNSGGPDPWSESFEQYYPRNKHDDNHFPKNITELNKYGWNNIDTDHRGYNEMSSRSLSSTGSVDPYNFSSNIERDNYGMRITRAHSDTDRWMGGPPLSSPPFPSSNHVVPMSSNVSDGYLYEGGSAEKTYATETVSSGSHYFRHARRLYVGGIPPGQTNEDQLKNFLNDVISKCLEEENNNSYILSVYMNHKKCFAFIELKSIELTQACLELDGIVYRASVLKIQRANEYKPELMVNVPRVAIRFNVSKAPFPNNVASLEASAESFEGGLYSFIRRCSVMDVYAGCVAIIGFPYDEGAKRSGQLPGAAAGSRVARQHLRRLFSAPNNPELGLDLTALSFVDTGDIALGLTLEEALSRLDEAVAEIVRRGGVPLVVGGAEDQSYATAAGLMGVAGGSIGVISVNSRLNVQYMTTEGKIEAASATRLLLSDTRFCPPRDGLRSEPWCDGKFIAYAVQGAYCSQENVDFVYNRGGSVLWLTKDIRRKDILRAFARSDSNTTNSDGSEEGSVAGHLHSQQQQELVQMYLNATSVDVDDLPPGFSAPAKEQFSQPNSQSARGSGTGSQSSHSIPPPPAFHHLIRTLTGPSSKRPVFVSFSMNALSSAACPGRSCLNSSGLSSDEALDMCLASGSDPNVAVFSISGLNPDVEEKQSGLLMAEMIYHFLMGFAIRAQRNPQMYTGGQQQYFQLHPPRSRGRSPASADRSPVSSHDSDAFRF